MKAKKDKKKSFFDKERSMTKHAEYLNELMLSLIPIIGGETDLKSEVILAAFLEKNKQWVNYCVENKIINSISMFKKLYEQVMTMAQAEIAAEKMGLRIEISETKNDVSTGRNLTLSK
jgi:hypothetical protein